MRCGSSPRQDDSSTDILRWGNRPRANPRLCRERMVPRPAPWSSSSSYLVESVCSPSAKRCQRPASAVRGRLNIVLTNFLSAASFRPRQQGDGHGLEHLVGQRDRKSVVSGKSVSVRVDLGGG